MDINALIIISCICMMFVIGKIFIVPIRWILKLVFNSVIGGFLIWIINMIGSVWGFHIGLNAYTSLLVRNARNSRGSCFDIIKVNCRIKKNLGSIIDMEPKLDGLIKVDCPDKPGEQRSLQDW